MKVEVWADFHCPYCVIGKAKLRKALKELSIEADIIPRSFLLNPLDDRPFGLPMAEHIAMEYGGDKEQAMSGFPALDAEAKEYGIDMKMTGTTYAFMLPAHRLFQFAKTKDLGNAFFDKAQRALFVEGKNLGDEAALLDIAESAGLDREEARTVLDSELFLKEVMLEDGKARDMVIDFVPYYIINDTHHFSGDVAYSDYLKHLQNAKNKEKV